MDGLYQNDKEKRGAVMLIPINRLAEEFKYRYFLCSPMLDALMNHLDRDICVNIEKPPATSLSLVIYCDDLTDEDLIRYHNAYCKYRIDSVPVMEHFDEMTAEDIVQKLYEVDSFVFKIV